MNAEGIDNRLTIYSEFCASQYATELAGRPRFDRYRPQAVDASEWIALLGPDVDNLRHHEVVLSQTVDFLHDSKNQRPRVHLTDFTPAEENLLISVAITHDWGERKNGDINRLLKTLDDEEAEMVELSRLIIEFSNDAGLAQSVIEVLTDKESKLGRAFDSIERVGYLDTALKAAEEYYKATGDELRYALASIVGSVFSNNLDILVGYADDYDYTKKYLIQNKGRLEIGLGVIDDYFLPDAGAVDKWRNL